MDDDAALEVVTRMVKGSHWLGEGTGGSGHMASVGLSGPEILSLDPIDFQGERCSDVVYAYRIERMSEFGGEVSHYKSRVVLSESGEIRHTESLEYREFDLLTGEERSGTFDLPEL
jgi:hypothetical protein